LIDFSISYDSANEQKQFKNPSCKEVKDYHWLFE